MGAQEFRPSDKDEQSGVNPFSADLNSNFSSASKGASNLFKDGFFTEDNRNKVIILGVLLLAILVGGFMWFTQDPGKDDDFASLESPVGKMHGEKEKIDLTDEFPEEMKAKMKDKHEKDKVAKKDLSVQPAEKAVRQPVEKTQKKEVAPVERVQEVQEASAEPEAAAAFAPSIISPSEGAQYQYDETSRSPLFTFKTSGSTWIEFSRNPSMHPLSKKAKVHGGQYHFRDFYVGRWFWRLHNSAGRSEVGSFEILPPVKRNVSLISPLAGATISGNGGVASWAGDHHVSYYRVELSNGDWTSPAYVFSTSGTSLSLEGVSAGTYSMRVGAFSEISGRWEHTEPVSITVQ